MFVVKWSSECVVVQTMKHDPDINDGVTEPLFFRHMRHQNSAWDNIRQSQELESTAGLPFNLLYLQMFVLQLHIISRFI